MKLSQKARREGAATWIDLAARLFILFFFIYSASVCPNDKNLESPVCRGLAEYRRLVVDPYILPPIQRAFNHPVVLPVVAWVKPRFDTTVEYSKPIVARTRKEWKQRVVPEWNRRVAPRLRRVEVYVQPYRTQFTAFYQRVATPYIISLQRYSRKAQPYLLMTAARTYDSYTASKPYLQKVTIQLQRIPPIFYNSIVKPLVLARRQFVDPHVLRMIDTIKELSQGRPESSSSSPTTTTFVRGAEFAAQTHFSVDGYDESDDATANTSSSNVDSQTTESAYSVSQEPVRADDESMPSAAKEILDGVSGGLTAEGVSNTLLWLYSTNELILMKPRPRLRLSRLPQTRRKYLKSPTPSHLHRHRR